MFFVFSWQFSIFQTQVFSARKHKMKKLPIPPLNINSAGGAQQSNESTAAPPPSPRGSEILRKLSFAIGIQSNSNKQQIQKQKIQLPSYATSLMKDYKNMCSFFKDAKKLISNTKRFDNDVISSYMELGELWNLHRDHFPRNNSMSTYIRVGVLCISV